MCAYCCKSFIRTMHAVNGIKTQPRRAESSAKSPINYADARNGQNVWVTSKIARCHSAEARMGCASSKPEDDRTAKSAPPSEPPSAKATPQAELPAPTGHSSISLSTVDVTEELAAHQEREYKGSVKPVCEADRQCTLNTLAVLGTVRKATLGYLARPRWYSLKTLSILPLRCTDIRSRKRGLMT